MSELPRSVHYVFNGERYWAEVPDFSQASAYSFLVNKGHGEPIAEAFAAAGMAAIVTESDAPFDQITIYRHACGHAAS